MVPVGFEPTRPKPAELKSAPLDLSGKVPVPPAGLEPATFRLEVECAIQLRQEGKSKDNLLYTYKIILKERYLLRYVQGSNL